MIELWTAIDNFFKEADRTAEFRAALTGGLHNTQSPQNVTYPHATFQMVSDVPDHFASSGFFLENCLIQFNLFSTQRSMSELLTLYDLLKNCLDFADEDTMTITNYELIHAIRQNLIVLPRFEGVWQANVTFQLLLEPA